MIDTDFDLYAIKLQPAGETGFFDACRQEQVIGTGWDPGRSCTSPTEIENAHKEIDGDRTTKGGRLRHELRYIVKEMNGDSDESSPDYVWVNEGSEYAICKVSSECTTSHDVPDRLRKRLTNENGTQIRNIRHVKWTDVPVEFVPGYVKRKFTGRFGTLNRMKKGVDRKAKKVVKRLHETEDFSNERALDSASLRHRLDQTSVGELFNILDADDTEELVLDYLQANQWRLTKYSTGDSQAKYECELRRVTNGQRETGFVQVKSGNASLDPSDYEELAGQGRVFLFSSPTDGGEQMMSVDHDSMEAIDPQDLADHLIENVRWLPTPTLLRLSFYS